jgi:hypothetical protein
MLLIAATSAHAQFRTIPDTAKRGQMQHVSETLVEINGQRAQLAAGAQIRDESNRIVVPAALSQRLSLVKYVVDASGHVTRVWILSAAEASQPDKAQ